MKKKKKPPTEVRAPYLKVMNDRSIAFGHFLANLTREMGVCVRTLCLHCGISEPHTFRGKLMNGIEVSAEIYRDIYNYLHSILSASRTDESRLLKARLEESLSAYYAALDLSVFRS